MVQKIKDLLVACGPHNRMVRSALQLWARTKGLSVEFTDERIIISRRGHRLVLKEEHFVYAPLCISGYNATFQHFEPTVLNGVNTLDFSVPALRKYRNSGLSLYCASLPEEDSFEMYTRHYQLSAGKVVWDVGANAGLTTYQFSKAVGTTGQVIAWEPDLFNFSYLLRNIELHSLSNVVPLDKALAGATGAASFDMDGSTGAGLSEHVVYSRCQNRQTVQTLSLEDACRQHGIPDLIKMDIEGGEVAVIAGARPFLKTRPPISFSIETHRMRDGTTSETPLTEMLEAAGYLVITSMDMFGQHFLWANYKP